MANTHLTKEPVGEIHAPDPRTDLFRTDDVLKEADVHEVLDDEECVLVDTVMRQLGALPGASGDSGRTVVLEGIGRMRELWRAIEGFPRVRETQVLGSRRRDLQTLLATFSKTERYTLEAYLPTRAALTRAYGMAKFNFCRMLGHVVDEFLEASEEKSALSREVAAVGRAAAAAVIAEDVLRSIVCDTNLEVAFRHRATRILAGLWDQRATQSLLDFAPLLDSAWRAKASVEICYGTMIGLKELFQMLTAGLDPDFVDFFGSDDVTQEQISSFEEFLFNSTYEQLTRLRRFMSDNDQTVLDVGGVARLFGVQPETLHTTTVTAEDMFFTFREREMWARMRRLGEMDGPKKTAEEYAMIYVLGGAQ